MKKILIVLAALMLLSACGARSEAHNELPAPEPKEQESAEPAPETDIEQPQEVFPLATFIELGAESCIPCKMMQPIMKEIKDEYQGLVKVIFIDLYKDRTAAQEYNVRVMPTQVFLDMDGREFFRHEGFYPKADIEKMLAAKIGVTKPKQNPSAD